MPPFCTTCRALLGAARCGGCGEKIGLDEGARCALVPHVRGVSARVVHVHATDCCEERAARRACRRERKISAEMSN